jgi:2-hydroxychromene-2-carboxylate isomerase
MEFWFDFASTYSYLAAARIDQIARVVWRPFVLGPIFARFGWQDSPFNLYPAKGAYMWRDMARTSERLAIRFRKPSVFPRNSVLAARVALVGADEPWLPQFARAVFEANFVHDKDIAAPSELAAILDGLGLPTELVARAQSPEYKPRLRAQTERATELGIFGAPTFVSDGELFWGNDRLDEAVAWAKRPRVEKS